MSYTYPEALNAMEKIAVDLFKRAWPGQHCDVRVVADSVTGTASVDWTLPPKDSFGYGYNYVTINMPVKPATYRMSADEFDAWAAYVLHEVGHPLHTDKATWKAAVQANEHRLLNSLEDVREEKLTIDLGLSVNARQVFSKLIDGLMVRNLSKGYDPNDVQNIGWTLSFLGRAANGYALDASAVTSRLDPKGVVAGIVPWALKELASTTSTQECWDLAKKIIAAVNVAKPKVNLPPEIEEALDGIEPVEPPHGGRNEDRGEEPQPEPEEQEPAGEGDIPDNRTGGESGPKAPEPVADADEVEEAKEAGEELFSDADVEEVDLKPNDRDEMTSTNPKTHGTRDVLRALRRVAKQPVSDRDVTGRSIYGSVDLVVTSASKMGQQRQLLANALKRNEEDSHDTGRLSGRLNGRALAKVAVRDAHVFGKRTTSEGYDTDVQVLVDGSGSMGGLNIQAASTLALVVAQAAAQVGVSCTAHVFNDRGLHASTRGRAKPKANKFAYMQNQILGGTPLTENLLRAVKLQKARAGHKRKVLFLITDGGCNQGPSVLKAAGEYVEQVEGVEIANLHIGHMPMGLFRNECAVNVMDVAKTGLRQLTSLLARGL